MNEAFVRGFIKAAEEQGLSEQQAIFVLQKYAEEAEKREVAEEEPKHEQAETPKQEAEEKKTEEKKPGFLKRVGQAYQKGRLQRIDRHREFVAKHPVVSAAGSAAVAGLLMHGLTRAPRR